VDADELDALTDRYLPEQFQAGALRAVFTARDAAYRHCVAEYEPEEEVNVRPFATRGKLEGLLRNVATLVPNVTSKVIKTRGQFWNHTEIYSGPVTLTAHAVQSPCEMVEDADYKRSLAGSNQGLLFGAAPGSRLYAVLLHSQFRGRTPEDCRKYANLPGSVYLAYPSTDLRGYLHKISLFVKFPNIVESYMPQEWDSAARAHYLRHADMRTA
jgi:hypothetical protein